MPSAFSAISFCNFSKESFAVPLLYFLAELLPLLYFHAKLLPGKKMHHMASAVHITSFSRLLAVLLLLTGSTFNDAFLLIGT